MPCSPPNFTPEQTWLTGGAVVVPSPTVTATIATSAPVLAVSASVASVSSSTTSSATLSATSPTTAPDTFTLPPPGGDGPGTPALCYILDPFTTQSC
jgi:hypothetical protein